jgi:hypothetical protein
VVAARTDRDSYVLPPNPLMASQAPHRG